MDLNVIEAVGYGITSIVIAISLHEMAHAYVANALGDDTAKVMGRVTINPLKHIDWLTTVMLPMFMLIAGLAPIGAAKPVPFNPNRLKGGAFGAALMAFSGPATNALLAVAGSFLTLQAANAENLTLFNFFITFTIVNTGFFVFNLIPIPPLDGSRILYALAPDGVREFMDRIERMGFIVLLFILILILPLIRPYLIEVNSWFLEQLFR